MSSKIQSSLTKFFEKAIQDKLENQFDVLCDQMINAISNANIDPEAASQHLHKFAKNTSQASIKAVLEDIANAKDKSKHIIFKTLTDKKKLITGKKNEPEDKAKTLGVKDFKADYSKVLDKATKYHKYLSAITNPCAKEFFLTFFSDFTAKPTKGFDPQ